MAKKIQGCHREPIFPAQCVPTKLDKWHLKARRLAGWYSLEKVLMNNVPSSCEATKPCHLEAVFPCEKTVPMQSLRVNLNDWAELPWISLPDHREDCTVWHSQLQHPLYLLPAIRTHQCMEETESWTISIQPLVMSSTVLESGEVSKPLDPRYAALTLPVPPQGF